MSKTIDGITMDDAFFKEWDKDLDKIKTKFGGYQPKRHLPHKNRIKRGLSVLQAGALYCAIGLADELGSEDAFVVWANKRENGDTIVSFKGMCPIHKYCHRSNNWSFIQSKKYPNNALLKCFHDGSTLKIPPLPFIRNCIETITPLSKRWQYDSDSD